MEYNAYKLSYYLNAQHSFDNHRSSIHSHTFHISLYLGNEKNGGQIYYPEVDGAVNAYLDQYSGRYLNETKPFDLLLPTIENLGAVFYESFKVILEQCGFDLIQLDICESPLRIYSISDRLYLGSKKTGGS